MDYDGDGRADFTVYQKGAWHFYNHDGTYFKGIWTGGAAGDIPVPGNYHNVGREEVVIFRGGAWMFYSWIRRLTPVVSGPGPLPMRPATDASSSGPRW